MNAGQHGMERRATPRHLPRLWPWFLLSCAIFGLFALPFGLDIRLVANTPPAERLSLDFLGVVGERQKEARQAGGETSRTARPAAAGAPARVAVAAEQAAQKVAQQAAKAAAKEAAKAAEKEAAKPPGKEAVFVEETPEESRETPARHEAEAEARDSQIPQSARDSAQPSAPSAAQITGADDNQQAKRITSAKTEEDALRRYAPLVVRHINAHLRYPRELRKSGVTGKPRVRFRIALTGEIVGGRVEIAQSSGHPALDQAAITATLAAAPFPAPARETEVAPLLAFRVE
ncbi:MAG: TonB family protein [Candidatus Accumulibacter sp.]|jgi:protein TonB|nr:TonB family protein [Accumulibacter sp.]